MGRSSKLQAGANRALIVEKASELFRARGIAEVSVSDIMQAAGMTSGGFYKHFASKEVLAAEAARLAFDRSRQHWDSIASDCPPHPQWRIAERYLASKPAEKRCPMMAFGSDLLQHNNAALVRDCTQGVNALLTSFLNAAGEKDRSSAGNGKTLAAFAAMVGANYLSEIINDPALSDALKTAVLAMLDT
ncbi:TetR/AcrR family transcriptional regulator [Sodalis praecaptivus]|uniref:TetR/AcrR family transcriptional regulator n=1 Tax=Sodalis praecaptivus TaxID=1239307 RepID=UPI0027F2E755|nr:TetR/AcrR family transcriptional regulator [Sodalis praecaptivus]CAJ0995207.1 hypothetical protein NVIRENTERO_01801 [Sodalis praecaptivus]